MNLLLDTHVLLWWLADDQRLGAACREAITLRTNDVLVSAATAWEISIKQALGKLKAPEDLVDQMTLAGFTPAPITVQDGLDAGRLPRHHDDPFDRMLIAQAASRNLTIVTADRRFAEYEVPVLPT
jgi:PIN domain nuclease of toxin-antitoxin system